jgi:guanylate kinase
VTKLLVDRYGMEKPKTATTRPRRSGEGDTGYRFLSEAEFIRESEAGSFLETTVYSGHHFGTEQREIDRIVGSGRVAVIPIDICGALTLKNRYQHQALLVFLQRKRYDVIKEIVTRDLPADDLTRRILSLDDEYRNEELCDLSVTTDNGTDEAAARIAKAIES